MRGQNMAVDQRFQDLQSGGFSSGDVELPEGTASSKELAAVLSTSSSGLDFGLGGNTGMFLSGTVGMATFNGTLNSTGYELTDYTLTAGVDTQVGAAFTVGVAAGFGESDATVNDDRGSLATTSMGAIFYATADLGGGAFVNAKAGAYAVEFDLVRNVALTAETYLGNTTGTQYVAGLTAGKIYDLQGWTVSPVVSAYMSATDVAGFTETDGNPLGAISVEDYTVENTWMSIGVNASKEFATSGGAMVPNLKVAYISVSTDASIAPAAFEELPTFGTPIDSRGSEYVNVGLGLTYLADRSDAGSTAFGIGYDGIFADSYDAHRVSLTANIKF